jgi:hypothetical protein
MPSNLANYSKIFMIPSNISIPLYQKEATMQSTMPQFEMRCANEKNWVLIPEKAALESLFDNFDRVSPIIDELFQGKEITFRDSVFRLRKP